MFNLSKLNLTVELAARPDDIGAMGAQLRGYYGEGLKKRVCDHRELKECRSCERYRSCEFPLLFKPQHSMLSKRLEGRPLGDAENLPAPFVIDPPGKEAYSAHKCNVFNFDFVGLGPVCLDEHFWAPLDAINYLARTGDMFVAGRPVPIRVMEVRDCLAGGRLIFDGKHLSRPVVRSITELIDGLMPAQMPDHVSVTFTTPVRLDWKKARMHDPVSGVAIVSDFFDFVRALVDRVAQFWQLYGENWPGERTYLEWRDKLLNESRAIETTDSDLNMIHAHRSSSYRKSELPMHGFVGTMQFAGDFEPFLKLLFIGEIIHIGQQTTNGLGKYHLMF